MEGGKEVEDWKRKEQIEPENNINKQNYNIFKINNIFLFLFYYQ